MNQQVATAPRKNLAAPGDASRPLKPIDSIRRSLDQMDGEFRMVLPQHITVDRFKRTLLTAINSDENLLAADRKSLFAAGMKAAQDGLLPDKKEGAFVTFNTKVKTDQGEQWIKAVQWMPMVYGIIKKMRNSGELASIVAHEVYEKDAFNYELGDDERILHRPYLGDGDPGKMIAVYSIARLKDGTIQREVMTRAQVERVRAVSRSKDNGPWVSWYEEMARKTVLRRLSKYLPMSTEIEDMLRRDDALAASADTVQSSVAVENVGGTMIEGEAEAVHETDEQAVITHQPEDNFDPQTGEVIATAPAQVPIKGRNNKNLFNGEE